MGYTLQTARVIQRHLQGVKSVLDFGSQNLYIESSDKPPFVSEWYKTHGITDYTSIDLAGDNDSLKFDVSYPIIFRSIPAINNKDDVSHKIQFDLVVDAGTSEHIVQMDNYETVSFHEGHIHSVYPKSKPSPEQILYGYYNCWLNKYNLCKLNGVIVSANPKTRNWIDHGFTYIDCEFYKGLAKLTDCKILELYEYPASGNDKDGWEIIAVIQKTKNEFPSIEEFKNLPMFDK